MLQAIIKPQYVDAIPKAVKGQVKEMIEKKNERNNVDELTDALDLHDVLTRNVENLSGGELQRFTIALTCVQKGTFYLPPSVIEPLIVADVYMLDEPSSYLDVKQRLNAARTIRKLLTAQKYLLMRRKKLTFFSAAMSSSSSTISVFSTTCQTLSACSMVFLVPMVLSRSPFPSVRVKSFPQEEKYAE